MIRPSFLDEFDDTNYEDPKSGETNDESYLPSKDEDLAGLYYEQLARNKKTSDICSFLFYISHVVVHKHLFSLAIPYFSYRHILLAVLST
jgi:hypothetical protein